MSFDIRAIDYADAQPFASRAAREHVSISPTRNTRWFAAIAQDQVVAVAGLLRMRGMAVRIKGVWVDPAARGHGLGAALVAHLIALAQDECAPAIEAYAHNGAFYQSLGFSRCGQLPNGAVRVRKTL